MAAKRYDLAVIGAGPGGYVAAIRGAQLGLKVLLVEKRATLGGTCLNIGCIPSKALLSSSELYSRISTEAAEHGIAVAGASVDLAAMMKRKEKVVARLTGGVAALMKGNKVEVVQGEARVARPEEVQVGGETYAADSIVLALGSLPTEIPVLPFDHKAIVDSSDALSFSQVPKKLLIVGAGIIGLELGSVWARLGAEVEFVELLEDILPGWDGHLVRTMRKELTRQGLKFNFASKVTGFTTKKESVVLQAVDSEGNERQFHGDTVLVAAGRRANLAGIDLAALSIATEKGRITVNHRFETSVSGVYAIGDCIRGPMLAHKAEEEGAALAELLAGRAGHVNYALIPGVLYTQPEAATVGKSEEELKSASRPYRKGVFQFAANGKALGSGMSAGFVKVLSDKENDRLLGVHIVGDHASDLIHEAITVMEFAGSAEDLGRSVFAHPTLSEAVKEAALAAWDKGIHGL